MAVTVGGHNTARSVKVALLELKSETIDAFPASRGGGIDR
jgi:hypothetical protein